MSSTSGSLKEKKEVAHSDDVTLDAKEVVVARGAAAAVAQTAKINPWTRDSILLYFCCFIAFLCACANGYDGSLMTAINIMPYYQNKFNSGTVGSGTALVFSIYQVGSVVGPLFSGPVTDRWGRRAGMFAGGIFIIIGAAVIASSNVKEQFIAGRFILGFGIAFMTTSAPSYAAEIPPVQWRGRITAFYNLGWFGGSIPAAAICLGTQNIKSDISWRLPLIFQCVPSIIVICVVWFLPESPRWLLANGRDEEALDFLARFHGNGDRSHPLVVTEFKEMKDSIQTNGADKRAWDYSELFRTRNLRYRTFIVILMGVFGQFSGNGLGYFNTEIFNAVGYDTHQQFVLNLGTQLVSCFGATWGVFLSDRMPRRKVLIFGTFLCAVFLAINGGLSAEWAKEIDATRNLSVGQGAVASYFLFQLIYSFTYTPLQALYPVEVLTTNGRAKGMAVYGIVVGVFGFINLYATPIGLQNIQNNFVFIFVAWDVIETIVWYLVAVETVGRSLEELDEVFEDPHPVRKSIQIRRVAIKEGGEVVDVGTA